MPVCFPDRGRGLLVNGFRRIDRKIDVCGELVTRIKAGVEACVCANTGCQDATGVEQRHGHNLIAVSRVYLLT